MSNSQRPYTLLLVFVLLAGMLLRFWDFRNMPFTFDELSALSRTTFDSFSEMIRVGVVEKDSHPAGVQSFLYFWVKLFGDNEMVVKLPFLLAGMASIWLAYDIGKLWFDHSSGILTAAYMSSLQFFVLYSQVARPYSSGLFLTLCMVWFWSRYFFKGNKLQDLLLFVVFGALSAYNHYISLLFVATVGLSGFFFTGKKNILRYVFSGVLMFLLYLPHLYIFLAQAEKGTIGGWLGEPGKWFILEYFHWLFHYSVFSYGLFLLILLTGILAGSKKPVSTLHGRKRIILFLWLLPAPIFGYVYSYSVEPILQFSLLIFSAPYFFILLFSFVKKFNTRQLALAVSLIILVNALTLVFNREHYRIFYKQPFQHLVKEAIRLEKEYPGEVFILNDYIPYYSNYYFSKYNKSLPYFTIRNKDIDETEFDSIVGNIDQQVVITSGLPPDYFQIVKKHFPNWTAYDYGFTFEQYTFQKNLPENEKALFSEPIESTDFSSLTGSWKFNGNAVLNDVVHASVLYPMNDKEWGPLIEFPLDSITTTGYIFIDIEMEIISDSGMAKGVIVAEIKHGEDQVDWRGKEYNVAPAKDRIQKVTSTLDIQVMLGNKMNAKDKTIRIYIWNPNKTCFFIDKMEIRWRAGNPYRYALYTDFETDW